MDYKVYKAAQLPLRASVPCFITFVPSRSDCLAKWMQGNFDYPNSPEVVMFIYRFSKWMQMDSKAKICVCLCVCVPFFIPFSGYFTFLLFLWLAVLASHWTAGENGLRAYFLYITPDTDGLSSGLESHIWCFIKNQLFKIQPLMQLFIISNCQKRQKKNRTGK